MYHQVLLASTVLTGTGRSVAAYDTGVITSYALYIMLGLVSLIGSFKNSTRTLIETGQCTTANKKGALTVQVWISQRTTAI